MKTTNKKLFIVAILLAVITTFMVFIYLRRIQSTEHTMEYVDVIIAQNNIEPRTIIKSEDVKKIEMIKEYVNSNACMEVADVVGKRAKERIIVGEQLLRDRIVEEQRMTLSYSIPEGKRAISINVNEAAMVSDFIRPGDYVDILATFDKYEIEDESHKKTFPRSTKVILQNILVLGMGQLQDIPEKPRTELPKTVTLAVTLQEAEKLFFGEETAVIRMVLRRVGDDSIVNTPGVIREELSTDKGMIILPK